MADEPFYAPNRKPAPPRQPRAGELLWRLHTNAERRRCELRDDGAAGCDLQLFRHGGLFYGRRHLSRAIALEEAAGCRLDYEAEGWHDEREGT